jgi:1-aminocyclopropane-1-carboxylate deaminase/D-cysteine desulfhydrase-like pyridoxal-dependent ACC family enzyme
MPTLTQSSLLHRWLPTPVQRQERLAETFGMDIDLFLKRDDLFPMAGGGSKSRKIQYIMDDMLNKKHDVLVTNGGPQSNHARSSALIAAELGMRCHLIIVLEPGKTYPLTGNLLLMKLSGAVIEFCEKEKLSESMDKAIIKYKKAGANPAYIWGGGHNVAGTFAFVDAAFEAQQQCLDWEPDYVVLASATGSTQAGLIIGYSDAGTKVIGISVAREHKRGSSIIRQCIRDYTEPLGLSQKDLSVYFRDEWTFGGYEKTSPELLEVIERAAKTGTLLDPTYSGKAFYGLLQLVKRGDIPRGSKILFWHTGGILNLIASRLANGHFSI